MKSAAASPQLPSPFLDVAQGAIPGVSLAPIQEGKADPAGEFVLQNFDAVLEAGLDYHELPDMTSVLFNPQKLTVEQIDQAFQAGTLAEIAPFAREIAPFAREIAPFAREIAAPAAAQPAAATGAPLAQAVVTAPPAGGRVPSDKKLETARLKNLAPAPKAAPNPVPGILARRAV